MFSALLHVFAQVRKLNVQNPGYEKLFLNKIPMKNLLTGTFLQDVFHWDALTTSPQRSCLNKFFFCAHNCSSEKRAQRPLTRFYLNYHYWLAQIEHGQTEGPYKKSPQGIPRNVSIKDETE